MTITRHKLKVGQLCFRIGLYKQGFMHDWSKYSPTEFIPGCKYYQGDRSPNAKEREVKGYSSAWLHHKGRNKHHWEYWVDFTREGPKAGPMPQKYVLEMFCDRVAASMIYKGKDYKDSDPLEYYNGGKDSYFLHPQTQALLEELLTYLSENGLDATVDYIKKNYR